MVIVSKSLLGFVLASLALLQAEGKPNKREKITLDEARQIAAKYQSEKSFVVLDDLKELDAETAAALAEANGQLSLKGLAELSPQVAEALAQHDGELVLDGLTKLGPEAAIQLGKREGALSLNGLKPTDEALEALVAQVGLLRLNAIESLTEKQAQLLALHKGRLELNGLKSLPNEIAQLLSGSPNEISLNGITELTPGAQRSLASHEKIITLGGLKKLTEVPLAEKLANQRTSVSLIELEETSDSCLEALVDQRIGLTIGLKELSVEQARILATHSQSLYISRVEKVSDEVAAELIKSKAKIVMSGLTQINHAQFAKKLATHRPSYLYFPQVKEISAEIARELASANCNLVLNGLVEMPDDVAAELANHKRTLSLDGVTKLSDAAAESLAKHQGQIRMKSLVDVSPKAIQLLEGKLVRK